MAALRQSSPSYAYCQGKRYYSKGKLGAEALIEKGLPGWEESQPCALAH
jgi:hypothetical protein